ncbi:hypothetical protein H5410_051574 [Solanum commersonii]|uniref:Uncharacterized protein n=1 Tax=Solanum commersonii TaxID=4109 RepID=A0A9J5WYT5_SOLCO|nr:hypothetical protein H5410_051574 [Solanum commersonii]
MLISSLIPIITWTCSLACLSVKSNSLKGKLVNIVVMPLALMENYCNSMSILSLKIMELLGMIDVQKSPFKEFFEDN